MNLSTREILLQLGRGDSIGRVCAGAGLSRPQFDAWWRAECRKRVPATAGSYTLAGLTSAARIERDRWGIPHLHAANDTDLFFAFGYATAQDRLFQVDFVRRRARGRLAEVLGSEAVESDLLYRTIGLGAIADREWATLPGEVRSLLTAYAAGVNAVIDASRANLPIEFDLLDYRPEPWKPADSLAILGEFRWYLTGRFPVIVIPELVKRALGEGPLYQEFLEGELDDESILLPGEYPTAPAVPGRAGVTSDDGSDGSGSNNWVLAGTRTTTGRPLVASDPHIPFAAVSIWQEVHLSGGSFQVAGVALAGTPAVMIGRNTDVAWGITNNICSQRDLYQEKTDPAHPGCFLFDGSWEPARTREEVIQVKGADPVRKVVHASRNGPIVDEVLPAPARGTGPVALRWLGAEPCGWLTALLGMNRAHNTAEFRAATQPWRVPTFSLVFADRQGHIGYQCAGRIPCRRIVERGYRPGWDPRHQWDGVLSFEDMPHLEDPARGFVVTANNRVAGDDYPFPLSGTWAIGHRARRCRELLQAAPQHSRQDCQAFHYDVHSGRAAGALPGLLAALAGDPEPRAAKAAGLLADWDARATPDSIPAALFNVFFAQWCLRVLRERFPAETALFLAANAAGLAARLLEGDRSGWFGATDRAHAIREAFQAALDELTRRLGPDMNTWAWGRLHILWQPHFLSGRGELGQLLDRSGLPMGGDASTVCCSAPDAEHRALTGAGYRMVADLADPGAGLWAVEVGSTSGHPGSSHYDDQLTPWSVGRYHYLPLAGARAAGEEVTVLILEPS
jgi:penicillin G amidase